MVLVGRAVPGALVGSAGLVVQAAWEVSAALVGRVVLAARAVSAAQVG